jgi:F0F1-type ATP synthase assembly protein I
MENNINEIEITKELTNHDENINSLKRRMDKVEEQSKAINNLAMSVKELAINMNTMNEKQEEQGKRLAELEAKPARRWEQIVSLIITTLVGALLGYLLSRLGIK